MYIACANFEDTISFYGEFKNPLGAIVEFIEGGEFNNYCDSYGIKSGEIVEVKVFKAIYKNDDNEEYFEIKNVKNQTPIKTKPIVKLIENNIPT